MKNVSAEMARANFNQGFSWVSSKVSIRHSSIQGQGIYALKKINKGETIVIQSGQIVEDFKMDYPQYSEISEIAFQIENGFHICPVRVDGKYVADGVFSMNHSCDPNCGVQGQITFVAIRTINEGEEITFDYAMTDANYEGMLCTPITPMRCACGAENCRKVITGDDWKMADLQKKYQGFFSGYIQSMIDLL